MLLLDTFTKALESLGLVLLALAVGIYFGRFDLALGVAAGGLALLAESLLLTAFAPPSVERGQ